MTKSTLLGITAIRMHKELKNVPPVRMYHLVMHPIAKYLITSILKHYLRYFFLSIT